MTTSVALTCLFIIIARICDVSLSTLRVLAVVSGRRWTATLLGFLEVLVWIAVASRVIQGSHEPAYMLSYAMGFSLGTYIGMTLEARFGSREQVLRLFSRMGGDVAEALRAMGFIVTQFEGAGQDGPISMLFLQAKRSRVRAALRVAVQLDPLCYCIVDDVIMAEGARVRQSPGSQWWPIRIPRR